MAMLDASKLFVKPPFFVPGVQALSAATPAVKSAIKLEEDHAFVKRLVEELKKQGKAPWQVLHSVLIIAHQGLSSNTWMLLTSL
jgi:hypothetical protein